MIFFSIFKRNFLLTRATPFFSIFVFFTLVFFSCDGSAPPINIVLTSPAPTNTVLPPPTPTNTVLPPAELPVVEVQLNKPLVTAFVQENNDLEIAHTIDPPDLEVLVNISPDLPQGFNLNTREQGKIKLIGQPVQVQESSSYRLGILAEGYMKKEIEFNLQIFDRFAPWLEVQATNHWSPRKGHQAFLGENGRLWVMGGYEGFAIDDNGEFVIVGDKNDIWYSDNQGTDWQQVMTRGVHWSSRDGHQAFLGEDGNRLWLMGGESNYRVYENDIWYSDNQGKTWEEVVQSSLATRWSPRTRHQAFLGEGGRLWVMGGRDEDHSYLNDIWYSDDQGKTWEEVVQSSSAIRWSPRKGHQAFLGEGGRLWVMGGFDDKQLNDIWYSDDQGRNWVNPKITGARWSGRFRHQAFLGEKGRLWVMGGVNDNNRLNDIWYSDDDGESWIEVQATNHWSPRNFFQAFLGEKGRLWVIGGFRGRDLNDIWYVDPSQMVE